MFYKYSWPSFLELKKKLSLFFKGKPYMIVAEGCKIIARQEEVVNIVLWGDAVLAFYKFLKYGKHSNFKLWTLGTEHAKLISTFYKIPIFDIGVIPRYKLFPLGREREVIPSNQTPISLVSSSSLQKEKNVDFCIKVMNRFQKNSPLNINCYICGPNMDNEKHLLKRIVSSFGWKIQPTLLGDLGTRWFSYPFKNPVLLNFSTSPFEDFGVSVAQAQSQGWPLIISNWGGHRDVVGSNVIKIPSQWIEEKNANKVLRAIKNHRVMGLPHTVKNNDKPRILNKNNISLIGL